MKKTSLIAGALLVMAPTVALLPGCGGGSGGVVNPTSTPGATPTVTPLPTETGTPTATTTGTPSATTTGTPSSTATPEPTATRTPRPTFTPAPTNTPIPGTTARINVTVTPSSDSNYQNIPLTLARLNLVTSGSSNTLELNAQGTRDFDNSYLVGSFRNAAQGGVYTATTAGSNTVRIYNSLNSGAVYSYRLTSGSITISPVNNSTATITYRNAVFAVESGVGAGTGTVTVNGTISGPYTTNG